MNEAMGWSDLHLNLQTHVSEIVEWAFFNKLQWLNHKSYRLRLELMDR